MNAIFWAVKSPKWLGCVMKWPQLWNAGCEKSFTAFSPQTFKNFIFFGLLNQKWIERSNFLRKILCTFNFSCFWIFGYLLFVVGKKIDFFFRPNDGLTAKISKFGYTFRGISHEELGLFLRCCEFLRFKNVKLYYDDSGSQSIDKKCHLFVKHLKPLKTAFSDSTIIHFYADIGYRQSNFGDPLQLLNHLRNKLLPICDSVRHYEFAIRFN